jgi:hypothetical protein
MDKQRKGERARRVCTGLVSKGSSQTSKNELHDSNEPQSYMAWGEVGEGGEEQLEVHTLRN